MQKKEGQLGYWKLGICLVSLIGENNSTLIVRSKYTTIVTKWSGRVEPASKELRIPSYSSLLTVYRPWNSDLKSQPCRQTLLVSGTVTNYCDIPSSYASLAVGSCNNLMVSFRPTHSSWAGQLKKYFLHLSSLNRQYWLLLRTPGFLYRTPTAECLLCAG